MCNKIISKTYSAAKGVGYIILMFLFLDSCTSSYGSRSTADSRTKEQSAVLTESPRSNTRRATQVRQMDSDSNRIKNDIIEHDQIRLVWIRFLRGTLTGNGKLVTDVVASNVMSSWNRYARLALFATKERLLSSPIIEQYLALLLRARFRAEEFEYLDAQSLVTLVFSQSTPLVQDEVDIVIDRVENGIGYVKLKTAEGETPVALPLFHQEKRAWKLNLAMLLVVLDISLWHLYEQSHAQVSFEKLLLTLLKHTESEPNAERLWRPLRPDALKKHRGSRGEPKPADEFMAAGFRARQSLACEELGSQDLQVEPTRSSWSVFSEIGIRDAIRQHISEVRTCHKSALDGWKTLQGRIVVNFLVGQDGHVRSVEIERNDTNVKALGCCVGRVVAGIRFPKPTDSPHIWIAYPFVFGPVPSEDQ